MKRKIIHYDKNDAGVLHCDECSYDLPRGSAWSHDLVGYPCPKCGADMLTEADYQKTEKMYKFVDLVNRWFGWLGSTTAPAKGEHVYVKIHGDTTIIKNEPYGEKRDG